MTSHPGPAFAPAGIWRDIFLVGYSQPYLIDYVVVTTPVEVCVVHVCVCVSVCDQAAQGLTVWNLNVTIFSNASVQSVNDVVVCA